ncbi:MAG: F0F1 ATP synthase subunit A [Candidatus Eremiobacteraeota bacterium]|nr:F0F1 ATP synthase subunit A [Candidatus Eremiobacteraeota bacterium]
MHEEIGYHPTWHLPLIGSVHADTVLTTWMVMIVALALFAWVGASYRSTRVTKRQTVFEGLINYLADLATSTLGPNGEPFVPFFISLFVYIFLLNQVGFLPFKQLGLPFGGSPTADLNTTAAYALLVIAMIYVVAIRRHGIGFFKHWFKPFWWLFPINVIEEFARPVTLALRLFFNIFVGEILLFVVATIITSHVYIGPLNLSLSAAILPFFIQFFNFFIGTLQAFVFTLLAIVYMSAAVADEH